MGFVWPNLLFSVSWLVDFQWGSCGSIFSFLCHGWQTFSGVRLAQSLVFCVMVGRLLVGFVWLNLQLSVSCLVNFQWAPCVSIFSFLCYGWQTFSGVRVAQSFVFCVMVSRLLVGFVCLNLQFSVLWLVDFQWGSCGPIFSFLFHGRQTFSGLRVSQSLVFCVMDGRLLVGSCGSNFSFLCHGWQTFSGFVWLNLQFSVSWLVDFQWGSCGSIFSFLCHGWQTFCGVRVAQSLVFCVMVGRLLVGFVCSIFSFLCHVWQTFSGVRVAQSLVFCVMVGRLLVGFVWLNLQFSVSLLVDFQWGSCGSIFSFLCHGWQTFSGVRVAQSLVFCVMVGRPLVGFVWLNLQFSMSWLVDFQWGSCGSIFSFLCHGWQTFSGLRVTQSLDFCVMVGRLLVGFVWLNLYFSDSWLVDCQWVRMAQSLDFCVMVGRLLVGFVWLNLLFFVSWLVDFQWGSCGSIFSFLCHGRQTFSGVRVAQSLAFCVMVGKFLVGFVWLNLQFFVSWQVDFQWVSCVSIFSFLCYGWQTFSGVPVAQSFVFCVMVGRLLVGFVWLNLQLSVSWQVDFQWGSCGSIFNFLFHGRQTFSGVRVAQSLAFCVLVGKFLVGFVWLNLQFFVSWQIDFQWSPCVSIFSFLCYDWQTFSGVRVDQSFVFCVMVSRLLVGFVCLNLQFSVLWLVDFQWGSCGPIFCFLCHGRQTFSGLRVSQSLVFCVMVGRLLVGSCGSDFSFLCHGWQTFSGFVWLNLQFSVSWLVDFQGVRVAQSLVFCVMVGRLFVGFVWLNLQFSMSWQVDFQWGSCGSIFSFLCHGWQTFSGVRVAQYLVFCVMVGRLLVGFVWLNLQFSVSLLVYFYWVRVAQSLCFLCHGWQTFGGVRVAQSLVFCVMVGRPLVGFVWLNLQFSVSWLVDFQWGSCDSIFSFLCHGWQTFRGLRVAQSLDFCVMVGRLLVGFVWLNLLFFVSWLVDFQWGSCGSIFSFLCHGRQIFSGVRVAQSLVFCVMVGRLLVGFLWPNLLFSVSWQVDFQWASCVSIFSFLCHGWQTFSGVRVAQSLVFCVMVGRLLVGFVWLNLQFSVSWLVDFQRASCGSIFRFLCHGWQTFSGVRVAQSFVFCVMVGRLLVGFVWLNLQFSVSWQVDFQWGSCGSIFSFLCYGWQTFSGVPVAQSFVFCVMVGRLLVGFVCLNLQLSVSWLVDFQWVRVAQSLVFCVMVGRLLGGSCGSIFSFLCPGWQTFSGLRVAQSLDFCVMVGRRLVGFVWLNLLFFVSWLVDFQKGSCGSNFRFLCHGRQTFRGVRVAQSLVFCVMVGRLLVGFVWLNLQFSVSWLVNF